MKNNRGMFLVPAILAGVAVFYSVSLAHAAYKISDGSVVGLYHLEDVSDSSGNGNTLTNTGSTATATALLGNGYNINSSGKWLIHSSNMGWASTTSSFSVSFWAKLNADVTSSEMTLFHLDSTAAGDYNYLGYQYNGGARRLYYGYSGGYQASSTNLGTTWHFFVYTRDGNGHRALWLDDVNIANNTTTATSDPGDNQFSIGSYVGASDNGTTNAIFDEAVVLNRIMTPAEIAALWNTGSGQEVCVTNGCDGSAPNVTYGSLGQFESDGTTSIPEGSTTAERTIKFSGIVNSSSSDALELQVEYTTSTSFADNPNITSATTTPSSSVVVGADNLQNGSYIWQARAVDAVTLTTSSWQEFGLGGTAFNVYVPESPPVEISDGSVVGLWHMNGTSTALGTGYGAVGTFQQISFPWIFLGQSATTTGAAPILITTSSHTFSGNQLSMVAWVNSGESITDGRVITLGHSGDGGSILAIVGNKIYCDMETASGTANLSGGSDQLILNHWNLVACIYNGSTLTTYLNGAEELQGSLSSPLSLSGEYATLMAGDDGSEKIPGGVDEVVVQQGDFTPYLSDFYNSGNGTEICLTEGCGPPPQNFYAQIENTSTLNLRDASNTSADILKELPADWIIQAASTTDASGNPMIADGIHWFKVADPTDGVTGWMAASDTSYQYISSYDGSAQGTFADMASTTQDDEASRATVIQQAVDHYYTNTSSTGSLYSSDDLSSVFSSSSPDTFPEDLIFPIAALEDGGSPTPAFNNEEVTFDYGHGIMQITPTPSSSDIYFLQKILNSNPATQVTSTGVGSPGMEGDHFGAATENAVERFQALYGLATSGQVLYYTRAQLNSMLPTSSIPAIPSAFRFERNLQEGMSDNPTSYSEVRGLESGVYIPPCGNLQDPSTSTYYQLCYGDNTSTDPKAYAAQPNYGGQVFKWYANTSQSIYSNIKDGLEILKEKYDACYDGSGGRCHPVATTTVLDGETFTYDQKRDILATWGYNGFVTSTGAGYLSGVANRLENINDYFASIPDPSTATGTWYNKLTVAADNFITFKTLSPVNATIIDSEGRTTGMVNGTPIAQIPDSEYNPDTDTGVVLFPNDTFTFSLKGTANDTYGFIVTSNNNSATTTVYQALNIPIKNGAIHTYTIDFNKLKLGQPGVTVKMDDTGDGKIDRTVTNIGTVSFEGPDKFVAPSFPVTPPKPKPVIPAPRVFQIQPSIPTSTINFASSTQISTSTFLATSSLENFTSTIEIDSSTIQTNSSTSSNE